MHGKIAQHLIHINAFLQIGTIGKILQRCDHSGIVGIVAAKNFIAENGAVGVGIIIGVNQIAAAGTATHHAAPSCLLLPVLRALLCNRCRFLISTILLRRNRCRFLIGTIFRAAYSCLRIIRVHCGTLTGCPAFRLVRKIGIAVHFSALFPIGDRGPRLSIVIVHIHALYIVELPVI